MNEKRSALDIPLFHHIYALYKLLDRYYPLIPKAKRYTLWQKCEGAALKLLEILIATSHQRGQERLQTLYLLSNQLDLLKVLIRLAKDTLLLNTTQYLEVQNILQEIGKMIGGWIKSVPH